MVAHAGRRIVDTALANRVINTGPMSARLKVRTTPWVPSPARSRDHSLGKPDSDGAFCHHVQRRVSIHFSRALARYLSPNAATGLDLLMGLAAAVLLWRDQWLAGAAMIQLFGVFSCVDGEVARLRGEASRLGDFLDTLTDRVTEASIVVALTVSLAVKLGPDRAWPAGIALLSGVMLLALSSEKFRSTYRMSYPKRRLESVFAVLSAGSDARLLVLTLAVVIAQIGEEAVWVLDAMWGLAILTYVNLVVRVIQIARHFRSDVAPKSAGR